MFFCNQEPGTDLVLSIFPIIEVGSRAAFTLKISGVVILGNVVGLGILWLAERRKASGR